MPQLCDHDEPCGCYAEGYAAGKDKAFFEVRNARVRGHAVDCGCEPCKTVRFVGKQKQKLIDLSDAKLIKVIDSDIGDPCPSPPVSRWVTRGPLPCNRDG